MNRVTGIISGCVVTSMLVLQGILLLEGYIPDGGVLAAELFAIATLTLADTICNFIRPKK